MSDANAPRHLLTLSTYQDKTRPFLASVFVAVFAHITEELPAL